MRIAPSAALRAAVANILIMGGILLTILRASDESYLSYQVAYLLMLAGLIAFRSGLQKLAMLPISTKEDLSIMLAAGVALFLCIPIHEYIHLMSGIFSATAAYICVRATIESYAALGGDFNRLARSAIACPFALASLVFIARTVTIVFFPNSIVDTADMYGQNAGLFLWAMLLLLMLVNIALSGVAVGRMVMRIRHLAERDMLTGVWNRRAIEGRLKLEREKYRRTGQIYSLAMLDLDHFKSINDRLGHDGGDEALKHVTTVISGAMRNIDVLGRFGGEEFLVLLPMTDLTGARGAAERMRCALAATPMTWRNEPIVITASIGLTAIAGQDDTDSALFKRADEAVYRAKAKGRNRIEFFPDGADAIGGDPGVTSHQHTMH